MKRAKCCLAIKSNYNKGAQNLKRLTPSQSVYYQYKEGRRPEWRRDPMQTEHSERPYIMDGKDGVYTRNRVHLCPTTPETSPEKSSPPASALNSHMDTEKSQDANRLNKSQAVWQGHSESGRNLTGLKITSSTFSFLNICACCKELIFTYQRDRQRTELVRVIHLCFILFYFSLFYLRETDVDILLLWARESVGTVRAWKPYMTCVYGPPCLSSSSSD